jgi:acyl dehydratase
MARRLLFGSPVVHGIHMLLWVLDCWITKKKKVVELSAINSTFIKPLNVGNEVSLINYSSNDKHEKIELSSNGVVLKKIDFVWYY